MKNWKFVKAPFRPVRLAYHLLVMSIAVYYLGWLVLVPIILLDIDVKVDFTKNRKNKKCLL